MQGRFGEKTSITMPCIIYCIQQIAANFLEDSGADALALNDIDETPTDVAGIKKAT